MPTTTNKRKHVATGRPKGRPKKVQPEPPAAAPVASRSADAVARLNERAMLVTLKMSRWTARKHDARISQEVADQHQSDVEMGRFHKRLLAKEALQAIDKLHTAAWNEHCYRTLPWSEGTGGRILASGGYFDYAAKMREYETQWNDAVRAFAAEYDQYVREAKTRLNGIFNAADYPSRSQIEGRFGFRVFIEPVPAAADFRIDLGESETALVRQQITASVEQRLNEAVKDIWARLQKVVGKMAERLRAYKVTEDGVAGVFRDTLVSNISDLLDVLPSLNVASDPAIDQFAAEIRAQLTANSAETLRDDEKVRAQTAAAAEAILSKMEAFIA